jgi:hypothetical protein
MIHVLRNLPFSDRPTSVTVAGEIIPVRAYQIVVWVSLLQTGHQSEPFPAVLDTGHSHNFSIREGHLKAWAAVDLADVPKRGMIAVNRLEVPLIVAELSIHRNRPGTTERLAKPVRLDFPEGIRVFPEGTPVSPRLPLLGLRGLVRNRLRLSINGLSVSLAQSSLPSSS